MKKPVKSKATPGSVAGSSAGAAHTKADESGNLDDNPEWKAVDRLLETPQEQWTVEQWRTLVVCLQGRYEGVVALLADAIGMLSVRTKALQFFEQELRAGRMSIKLNAPRKRAGRKPNLSKPELQEDQTYLDLLQERASGKTRAMAAQRVARKQLEGEGLSERLLVGKLAGRKKTLNNKFPKAEAWATENAFLKHGLSLAAIDELMTLGVPTRPKARTGKKKSSQ